MLLHKLQAAGQKKNKLEQRRDEANKAERGQRSRSAVAAIAVYWKQRRTVVQVSGGMSAW